jgi:hypothetical protein
MGPVWLLLSIFLLLLAAAGLLNFPYIPLFFGIHGANAHSLRGRIISKALAAFPVVTLISLVLGWLVTPVIILLPLGWLFLLWFYKPVTGPERTTRFANAAENLQQLAAVLDYELAQLNNTSAQGHYLLYSLLCPNLQSAEMTAGELASLDFYSPAELKPSDTDYVCILRLKITTFAEQHLRQQLDKIIRCAWQNQAIVSSLSILRE